MATVIPVPLSSLDLSLYSDSELRALSNRIVDMLKCKERSKVDSFRYGDKVEWMGRYGHQTGSVVKVNRQTVMVCADGTGTMWKVSGSLLTKIPYGTRAYAKLAGNGNTSGGGTC